MRRFKTGRSRHQWFEEPKERFLLTVISLANCPEGTEVQRSHCTGQRLLFRGWVWFNNTLLICNAGLILGFDSCFGMQLSVIWKILYLFHINISRGI